MAKKDKYFKSKDDKITFNIINKDTVKRLERDGKIKLPKRKLNIPKDRRWNEKSLNSAVLKGINNGDSVQKIANRIFPEIMRNTDFTGKTRNQIYGKGGIIAKNRESAIRAARTMTTSAQNNGRLDSYNNLDEQGVVQKKVWIATPDDRTRESHLEMDGEEVDINEEFSNGCMFPGDANCGDPAEVWNCRCSMRDHIIGFRKADGSISYVEHDRDDTTHERQMEEEKERRESEDVHVTVDGKDISQTWERRPDQFDFEIEDIINAQGFDGLPRVVSADEFERYAKESNMVALRGYTAPDKETLKAYEDQLYHGKWYVDCSVGGSAAGQGMYSSWNKGTEPTKMISDSVAGYAQGKTGKVETFTLSKDAKIITHKEAVRLKDKMDDIVDSKGEHPYRSMDEGCIAALYGYDAIRVGGENIGDLVVLNRTKCIFKGE